MIRLSGLLLCGALFLTSCGSSPTGSSNDGGTPPPGENPYPGHLNLLGSTTEMLQAESLQLTALVRSDEDQVIVGAPISWTTSRPEVATVDGNGKVHALSPGTVTIRAHYGEQVQGRDFTVFDNAPVSIVVKTQATSVNAYFSLPLEVQVFGTHNLPISSPTVTWSTDNPLIGTVNSAGVVRGLSPGILTVNIASGQVLLRYPIRVRSTTPQSIQLAPLNDTLLLGTTIQLQPDVTATDGLPLVAAVRYSISGTAVTVSPTGLLQAKAGGTATVTVSAGNVSAQRTVAVYPFGAWATSVYISPFEEMVVGQTQFIQSGGIAGNSGVNVEWPTLRVSDPALASVNGGIVTALAPGVVTLTASTRLAAPVSRTLVIHPQTSAPAAPAFQSAQVSQFNAGGGEVGYQPSIILREASGVAGYRVTQIRAGLVGVNALYAETSLYRVNAGGSRTMWDTRYIYDDPFALYTTNPGAVTGMTIDIDYIDDAGNHGTLSTTVPIP